MAFQSWLTTQFQLRRRPIRKSPRRFTGLLLEQLEDRLALASGDVLWLSQFGGAVTPVADVAKATAVDAAGNVYVAGYTNGALPGQTSAGDTDAFVRKYDSAGNVLWTRQFGSAGLNQEEAYDVAVDIGGVYVAGYTIGTLPGQTSAGNPDAFVRKYDFAGTELWTRQFGSPGLDQALSVAVNAGGVYVAGSTTGTLPGQTSAGSQDAFVRKYDAAGTELWTRQFGSTNRDQASGVAVDASGVYVAGVTQGTLPGQTSGGSQDPFVRKYDAAGTELWTRQFGSPGLDQALSVAVNAGGVYVAGFTSGTLPGQTSAGNSDAFVRKYDLTGTELWTRQFGSTGLNLDEAYDVAVDAGGVYVAGLTTGTLPGQTSAGSDDAFVRKYDAAGTELWTRQFGSPGSEQARGVGVDAGGVYVAGLTTGTLTGQTSAGSDDAFVAKIVENAAASTSVAVASSTGGTSTYGTAVTFSATVTATSGGAAATSGNVQFYTDGNAIGSPVAVNGSGVATSSSISLPVTGSPHVITANYLGVTNTYEASNGTLAGGQTVTPAGSTVTVTLTDGASTTYDGSSHGATASWASTGSDGAGTPLIVTYVGISGTVYGPSTTAPTNAGNYRASASYPGDSNYAASSNFANFTIAKATLTGDATTQDALNMVKQGKLTITISNVAGLLNGDTLATFLSTAEYYITVGANRYAFVPTSVTTSGSSITVAYTLKNSALVTQLAAELADNTSGATAVSAGFSMESTNYLFTDDYLTRMFSTAN